MNGKPKPAENPDDQNARVAMKAIRGEIKRILDSWDPLFLRGLPGFASEYNQFAGPLSVLVRKGAAPMEIARHLQRLMIDEWKMADDRAKCLEVAEKIHRVGKIYHIGN